MSSFKTSQKDSCQSICPSEQNLSITDLSPLPLNVDPLKARCKQERVGGFYSFRELSIKEKRAYVRNIIGFFLLGLLNNYPYCVFNSAALALLNGRSSPGTLLLCSILPAFLIAAFGPWFIHRIPYVVRMSIITGLSCISFLMVGLWGQSYLEVTLMGVFIASVASGLGEPTYLAFSSFYNVNTVSAWSSGTGFAGVFGAFSWLVLHAKWGFDFSTRTCLFVVAPVPLLMAIVYLFLLTKPSEERSTETMSLKNDFDSPTKKLSFRRKLSILPHLLIYMVPLCIVYFAEYSINSGVTPALVEPNDSKSDQFTALNLCYQGGVFVSRSSVNIWSTSHVWIFSVVQISNFIMVYLLAWFQALPSIYILYPLIVFEGLMGGFSYVNAFYAISKHIPEEFLEFSMAATVFGSNLGITAAAIASIYILNSLCNHIDNPNLCISSSFW